MNRYTISLFNLFFIPLLAILYKNNIKIVIMKKHMLILGLLLASFTITLNAQMKSEVQLGLALPQGDFNDDNENRAIYGGDGVAATGFYIGYKAIFPLTDNGLSWTLNAGIMYNDLQSDFKDDLDDNLSNDVDDYTLPKYINIPVFAGLQYETPISDNLDFLGEGGLGFNLLKVTKEHFEGDYYEEETTFESSIKLGFKLAAGIVIQDKYVISLNYLGLGSHKVKYEYEYEYNGNTFSEDDKFDRALSVSTLNLNFGIRF
jgi:hypothetical protein